MTNYEFIICHFISHSEIICHVTLSCTENDKLIELTRALATEHKDDYLLTDVIFLIDISHIDPQTLVQCFNMAIPQGPKFD